MTADRAQLFWRALTIVVAVLAGITTGQVAAYDAPFSTTVWSALSIPFVATVFPFILSTGLLGMAIAVFVFVRFGDRAWHNREMLLITLAITGLHLMGLDAGPINLLNISIVAIFGIWLLHWLGKPNRKVIRSPFRTLVVAMLVAVFISAFGHHSPEVMHGLLVVLPKLALVIMLIDLINTYGRLRYSVAVFIVTAGLSALVGVIQIGLYAGFLIEFTLMAEEAPRYVTIIGLPVLRSAGFLHTPHGYSQPIAVAVLLSASLLFAPLSRAQKAGLALVVVLGITAVGVSFARSQLAAMAFALAFFPFVLWPHRSIHLACFGLLAIVVGFGSGLIPWVINTVVGLAEGSVGDRRVLLAAGMQIFVENFWNGVGLSDFGRVSPSFDRYPVHNAPFQVATETGIFGFLAFIAVFVWCALRLMIAIRNTTTLLEKRLIGGLGLGLIVIIVGIQAEPLAFSEFIWVYLALCDRAAAFALQYRDREVPDHGVGYAKSPDAC